MRISTIQYNDYVGRIGIGRVHNGTIKTGQQVKIIRRRDEGTDEDHSVLSKVAQVQVFDGWIMGPIGHAAYPRGDPTWVMPPVRKKFDLFAAVRPALAHAAIPSVIPARSSPAPSIDGMGGSIPNPPVRSA